MDASTTGPVAVAVVRAVVARGSAAAEEAVGRVRRGGDLIADLARNGQRRRRRRREGDAAAAEARLGTIVDQERQHVEVW